MEHSSQDYASTLVMPFQALSSNASQLRALEGLVKSLTHQQIRKLQSTIAEIDFHCDIVTELPLEISQIILRYLPPHQIFQARRVSLKWKQLLSPPQTIEILMQDWYPQRGIERGLHIPAGLSADSVASLTAEHIDAYRTGNAFKYATLKSRDLCDSIECRRVAYADGIMAWVAKGGSAVKLLDLKTGREWSFRPETRPLIHAIAVSSSMVAILGSGRCYVLALKTGHNHLVRIPSDRVASIAVSSESLAIVCSENDDGSCRNTSAFTWTLKNQKTSSFALPFSLSGGSYRMMLDNRGETLLLFRQDSYANGLNHFHYIRASLDGNVLAQGDVQLDLKDYRDCSEGEHLDYGTVPKEANGKAVIWSYAKPQPERRGSSELTLVCYNLQEDRLEVRKQVITGLDIKPRDTRNTFSPPEQSPLFYWKDVAYFLDLDDERRYLSVLDLKDSTCRKAKMGIPRDVQAFVHCLVYELDMITTVFGDETFLVAVFDGGFCVWCFDANTQLFDEDIGFQKQRKIEFERRLRLKQDGKS